MDKPPPVKRNYPPEYTSPKNESHHHEKQQEKEEEEEEEEEEQVSKLKVSGFSREFESPEPISNQIDRPQNSESVSTTLQADSLFRQALTQINQKQYFLSASYLYQTLHLCPNHPQALLSLSQIQPFLSHPPSTNHPLSHSSKPRGKKILCLDGGGIRGLIEIRILQEIEKLAQKPIHELFDMICGTSTGVKNEQIFGAKKKFPFPSYHEAKSLVSILSSADTFSDHKFSDFPPNLSNSANGKTPYVFIVSCNINKSPPIPYLFRNYDQEDSVQKSLSFRGDKSHMLWQGARATSAAPVYFEAYEEDTDIPSSSLRSKPIYQVDVESVRQQHQGSTSTPASLSTSNFSSSPPPVALSPPREAEEKEKSEKNDKPIAAPEAPAAAGGGGYSLWGLRKKISSPTPSPISPTSSHSTSISTGSSSLPLATLSPSENDEAAAGGYMFGLKKKVSDAARGYINTKKESHKKKRKWYFVDGGVLANNPSLLGYVEAKELWGEENIETIVSLGTGLQSAVVVKSCLLPTPGTTNNYYIGKIVDTGTGLARHLELIKLLLDSATDSESVSETLKGVLTKNIKYWRFNPQVNEVELDTVSKEDIDLMLACTEAFLNNETVKKTLEEMVQSLL